MRKFLGCCSIFLLVSCLNESRVDPATPTTFVRYINGGTHDRARALEKTSDGGYIILANTELKVVTGVNDVTEKIKLVKVSAYGSVEWTKVLPLPENMDAGVTAYHGNGIYASDEGYIISGEVIQANGKKQLLIMETNTAGEKGKNADHYIVNLLSATIQDGSGPITGDVSGSAVTKVGDKLLVLSSLEFTDEVGIAENMILAEVNPLTKSATWEWRYGNGSSTLVNQIFLDAGNQVVFGGTLTANSKTDLRLIKTPQNSQTATFDLPFGDPDRSERANNICRTANGFAMVGSSDVSGAADTDILFTRLSATGSLLFSRTYPAYFPGTDPPDPAKDAIKEANEEGNDVCVTKDNGFIILATVTTTPADATHAALGRGELDYYLVKVNAFGEPQWTRAFGSRREDRGVAVTQAADEGYVILGNTYLANLWTITLIKTNSAGEVE